MGCIPCGAKQAAADQKYVWTDGSNTIVYPSLAAAKTKVRKRGGTYSKYTPGVVSAE